MSLDLVSLFQECAADIKDRMLANKLKLNDDKTEVICPLHLPAPTCFQLLYLLALQPFLSLIWSGTSDIILILIWAGRNTSKYVPELIWNLNATVWSINISQKKQPKHLCSHVFFPGLITVIPFSLAHCCSTPSQSSKLWSYWARLILPPMFQWWS